MTAINQKIRRLPGFVFETRTAMREDVLPRMDVALFIGFAAKGPIDIPVALESADQFEKIFGDDLPLVWDRKKGAMIYAYLAPTVRMFFRNGGRRCWVIRTARVEIETAAPLNRAAYNFFPLTNLADIRQIDKTTADIQPAFVRSRSKGSWSDDLKISTAILATVLKFESLAESGGRKILQVEISANQKVQQGDLLKLDFPDSDLSLFLTADEIESVRDKKNDFSSANGKSKLKITSERFVWTQDLPPENLPDKQNAQIKMWTRQIGESEDDISVSAQETRQAELSFEKIETGQAAKKKETRIRLKFSDLSETDAPEAGSLMVTKFQNKTLCLQVENVINAKTENQETVHLICQGAFIKRTAFHPISKPDVELLNFDIWVKEKDKTLVKLNDLSFNSPRENFWGNLLTDDERYDFHENQNSSQVSPPHTDAFTDSPLAGSFGAGDGFFVPIFPSAAVENYPGAIKLNGTKLQRDGLQIFDENLFLDEKLKFTRLNNLLNDAEYVRYLSPQPRKLRGIHSALAPETATLVSAENSPAKTAYASLSLDEATIISVPDALHRGWFFDDEKSSAATMKEPFESPLRPEWWRFQDCRKPKIKMIEKPLWGNFLDCDLVFVDPPKTLRVAETEISGGSFTLVWNHAINDKKVRFVLQESATPKFEFAQEIYKGKNKKHEIISHGAGVFYYRVRAEIGDAVSDWSNGLKIKISAAKNWTAKFTGNETDLDEENLYSPAVLLAVQRSLLRMCAARGDIFAVLDLPEHFDAEQAVSYISALKATRDEELKKDSTKPKTKVEPLSADENTAFSFGAIYHPWLLLREDNFEEVRTVPPCGAICGTFAKRSAERGAWIAPANESLRNVLGLAKIFSREEFLSFQDVQLNIVRHEPTGFLVLASETLSDELDLRQINVRRLLSLLRRLALKHGAEYVFEPNNEKFRRSVQRGFKSLLEKMFVHGAFAGTTQAASYQVVVSDAVNNFQSVEQGRFIVELRVAPSLPLKFVTVRMINSGGRSSISETV